MKLLPVEFPTFTCLSTVLPTNARTPLKGWDNYVLAQGSRRSAPESIAHVIAHHHSKAVPEESVVNGFCRLTGQ